MGVLLISMVVECIISVDVEASGPIPGEYSMLSLGACVVGNTKLQYYVEIKPLNDNYVDKALAVCNLSMEELRIKGEDPSLAMDKFASWVKRVSGGAKPVFCSFGTFDWMFTKWYLVKFGDERLFGPNGCDMKSYYAGMMNSGFFDSSKRVMPSIFKPSGKHTHNALDDAIEQAEIFERFLDFNFKEKHRTTSQS